MCILNVRSLSMLFIYPLIDDRILSNNTIGFTEAHQTVLMRISTTIKIMFLRLDHRCQGHCRIFTEMGF